MLVIQSFCVLFTGGNYRYSESHEWASLDGSIATVGISNYAQVCVCVHVCVCVCVCVIEAIMQDKLGDAVFVDAPDVGDQVIAGGQFENKQLYNVISSCDVGQSYTHSSGGISP